VLAPDWSRGCTLSSSTRGDTTELHRPLQRLLEDAFIEATVRARRSQCNERRQGVAITDRSPAASARTRDASKRRVFGFSSQLFMSFKLSLGCGL